MSADWIEWSGGLCPVAPETMVEVRLNDRVGYVDEPARRAGDWFWSWGAYHHPRAGHIIAYRVVPALSENEGEA